MKKIFVPLIAFFLLAYLSGCAAVLIGGAVAGGVAISKDTAKLEKDTSYDRAWSIAYKTINNMGRIDLQDKKAGKIQADIKDAKVTAQITQITAKSVRIEVKARKNLFPNIDLAVDIINKINSKL